MAKTSKKSAKAETTNHEITASEPSATKGTRSHPGKKILSIGIDPALHARLSICARAEGRSVTDLCVEALSKNLKARINSALDALRAEADLGK